MRRVDIKAGDKFGMLTVLRELEPNITPCGTKQRKFECQCDCGNKVSRTMMALRDPYADCGCTKRSIKGKKRMYKGREIMSFLYTTFEGMKRRCYDTNFKEYKNYGGRGIKICNEWLNDFFSFYDWAVSHGASEELTIDRMDNNGNYCPENCRWTDRVTQANNTSKNRVLTYKGQVHTLAEWARIVGLTASCISWRIDEMNLSIGQALGYEHINFKSKEFPITFNGVTLNVPNWSKKLGIKEGTIYTRLRYGLPVEDVLNPNYKPRREWGENRRLKRSLKMRGELNFMYGKNHTEQTKKKMSKPIVQLDEEGNVIAEYYGITYASKQTGCKRTSINDVLRGRRKSTGGYFWKYKD